jgi:transposase
LLTTAQPAARIDGLGPYLSLKLIAECGDDLSSWPSSKHFTSWLVLAPALRAGGGGFSSAVDPPHASSARTPQ